MKIGIQMGKSIDMDSDVLIAIYNERSDLANVLASFIDKEISFFTTIILATITATIALLDYIRDTRILSIFSILGIIFSLAGLFTFNTQRKRFYRSLYSLSIIRKSLSKQFGKIIPGIDTNNDHEFSIKLNEIGIYQIDFDKYPTITDYLKSRSILSSSLKYIYLIYSIFIILNIAMILYFFFHISLNQLIPVLEIIYIYGIKFPLILIL